MPRRKEFKTQEEKQNLLNILDISIAHWRNIISQGYSHSNRGGIFDFQGSNMSPSNWKFQCRLCEDFADPNSEECVRCPAKGFWRDHTRTNDPVDMNLTCFSDCSAYKHFMHAEHEPLSVKTHYAASVLSSLIASREYHEGLPLARKQEYFKLKPVAELVKLPHISQISMSGLKVDYIEYEYGGVVVGSMMAHQDKVLFVNETDHDGNTRVLEYDPDADDDERMIDDYLETNLTYNLDAGQTDWWGYPVPCLDRCDEHGNVIGPAWDWDSHNMAPMPEDEE